MWTHKRKLIFNPDISKQTHMVTIFRKLNKEKNLPSNFNAVPVTKISHQEHLGLCHNESL